MLRVIALRLVIKEDKSYPGQRALPTLAPGEICIWPLAARWLGARLLSALCLGARQPSAYAMGARCPNARPRGGRGIVLKFFHPEIYFWKKRKIKYKNEKNAANRRWMGFVPFSLCPLSLGWQQIS